MSDQAQFTGFDDGNSVKAMNITSRSGRNNGVFGKLYAGYGYLTDSRYSAGQPAYCLFAYVPRSVDDCARRTHQWKRRRFVGRVWVRAGWRPALGAR